MIKVGKDHELVPINNLQCADRICCRKDGSNCCNCDTPIRDEVHMVGTPLCPAVRHVEKYEWLTKKIANIQRPNVHPAEYSYGACNTVTDVRHVSKKGAGGTAQRNIRPIH
jgi:hypothetical protein